MTSIEDEKTKPTGNANELRHYTNFEDLKNSPLSSGPALTKSEAEKRVVIFPMFPKFEEIYLKHPSTSSYRTATPEVRRKVRSIHSCL